jgi:hemerythrin
MEFQMVLFRWYKKYSVNNEELDRHHKKILEIFNGLYDNCLQVTNADCVGPIIVELIEFSNIHFSAEEKYMGEIGYKEIDEHKQLHRYFSEKLLEMQQVENKNDYDYTKELIVFLGEWILQHVIIEDNKYTLRQ